MRYDYLQKKHLEIRIFTPNIWYPIHSGKSFIENRGNAPKKGQIGEIPPPPKKTKIVLIKIFCEEQIRISRHFAIHFRNVKYSRIYTDFIQICLKYTFFTSKIMLKLHNFAFIFYAEWFSIILRPITKIEKDKYFSWKSEMVQGYALSRQPLPIP